MLQPQLCSISFVGRLYSHYIPVTFKNPRYQSWFKELSVTAINSKIALLLTCMGNSLFSNLKHQTTRVDGDESVSGQIRTVHADSRLEFIFSRHPKIHHSRGSKTATRSTDTWTWANPPNTAQHIYYFSDRPCRNSTSINEIVTSTLINLVL